MNERDVFIAALEKVTPAERQAYLAEACGGRPELRRQVEELLWLHEGAGSFLQQAAAADRTGTFAAAGALPEMLGAVIGPYRLLEQIGEGGMGLVFVAAQTEPVSRQVALKVIKPGMDSKQVIARFEAERQALAKMDHPNIAKVFDGGTTPEGKLYFVMELVKGVPITDYCDQNRLTTRQRLELFVQVCAAVQHAHTKGIIHRDLKPSNVLVALYDGAPVPKVIDFGVAKAVGQQLTDKTVYTHLAQMVGTPLYMSPEQAGLSTLDVDTRSDIYSLGVLLYQLLTGTTPFDGEALKEVGYDEMRRIIREDEPPRPSARLSTLQAQALSTVAEHRGIEPRKLDRQLRGELDWIVMKALEKDRTRRYETASAFAADVQRYLADEPVQACPPSTAYRLKKFLRRNRGPVLAVALVLLALVGGIIGTTWQAVRATWAEEQAIAERDKKDAARRQAEKERDEKETARAQAEADRDRAAATLDAMTSNVVGDALTQQKFITPEQKQFLTMALDFYGKVLKEKGNDVATRKRLAAAAGRVGMIEARLGRHEEGAAMFRQAGGLYAQLAAEFPAVAEYRLGLAQSRNDLGILLSRLGKRDQAEKEYRAGQDIMSKLIKEFPDEPRYRYDLAVFRGNLGTVLVGSEKWSEAETEYRAAHDVFARLVTLFPEAALFREHLAASHVNLGRVLHRSGQRDRAETEFRTAIGLGKQLVSEQPTDPEYRVDLARSHSDLGRLLADVGKRDLAETEYRAAIDLCKQLAAEYPGVPEFRQGLATSHDNFGLLLQDLRKHGQAEAEHRAALGLHRRLVAEFPAVPTHRDFLASSHNNLGLVLAAMKKWDEAETEYRAAIDLYKKLTAEFPTFPEYAIGLGGTFCNLGHVVRDRGRPKDALGWYRQAIDTLSPVVQQEPSLSTARRFLLNSHRGRAGTLDRLERHDDAAQDWACAMNLAPGKTPGSDAFRSDGLGEKEFFYMMLMLSRARGKEFKTALRDADQLAKSAFGDVVYNCACVYALAHAETRDARHAVRAVELLRQAAAKGCRNVVDLKEDPYLDSLRARDDFRQFVAELEKAQSSRSPPDR